MADDTALPKRRRRQRPTLGPYSLTCEECSAPFTARRRDARFCSDACNSRWYDREHREERLERRLRYRQQNREQLREKSRAWRAANPERAREQSRRWRAANPEKALEGNRRRAPLRENMATIHGRNWREAYAVLWDAQDGRCYLCGDELDEGLLPGGRGRGTTIDHDHRCCPDHRSCPICRRGLACNSCNAGIAYFKDDPARLRRVADALEAAKVLVGERLSEQPAQGTMF